MLTTLFVAAALAAPPEAAMASPIATLPLATLEGNAVPADRFTNKALLVVNVASYCGYTSQYSQLQALADERGREGLEVVGVPCNQFGGQEPGSAQEIASFCKQRYGVTFPLLEKQDVNGPERSKLYEWLVNSEAGGGRDIGWNFEKFVVDREGNVVARFGSSTTPSSPALRAALDQALKP